MTITEAADRLAKLFPDRYTSVEIVVNDFDQGRRETRCQVYAERKAGETKPLLASAPTFSQALARIAPDTTEREEEQGDGEADVNPYLLTGEELTRTEQARKEGRAA